MEENYPLMATMPLGVNYFNWSYSKKNLVVTGGLGGVIFARGWQSVSPQRCVCDSETFLMGGGLFL